ncbi:MAG: xanthine dehydrogenase family protein subunit M [Anaerolineales bacterium]|jgi:carbon-monoxide dehydrogenase medium subunit|nr:xanthine dehydrogenase family protein subunit M [Anaerolineales bacterium]
MNAFLYLRPQSLDEVITLLVRYGREARLLAGGTDLLVQMRHDLIAPQVVIDLKRVAELRADVQLLDGVLRIGALTVLSDLIEDARVQQYFPALVEAASVVGSVQIRNRATLSGNICNASPAADTAPALLIYDAQVNLIGPDGRRTVALCRFFLGPRKTVLQQGELVEAIDLPLPREASGAAFTRLTRRRGVDLATVNAACLARRSDGVTFAFGAVAPTPILVPVSDNRLLDTSLDAAIRRAILDEAAAHTSPISDVRASREYRLAMVKVMAERALEVALQRLTAAEAQLSPVA